MRDRKDIEQDGRVKLELVLEVLLDIRDLLAKKSRKAYTRKRKTDGK